MKLAVPCFGDDPRWAVLLAHWWESYQASGCTIEAEIITTPGTSLPDWCEAHTVRRYNADLLPAIIRDTQAPFDRHGSLILQTILDSSGPIVIIDADCFFLADPTQEFLEAGNRAPTFGMAADCGHRKIAPEFVLHEHNGGVILVTGDAGFRQSIVGLYVQFFHELLPHYRNNSIFEQVVFSRVWHELRQRNQATMLPHRLNHSHWMPTEPDTLIRHEHGAVKWHRVKPNHAHA